MLFFHITFEHGIQNLFFVVVVVVDIVVEIDNCTEAVAV